MKYKAYLFPAIALAAGLLFCNFDGFGFGFAAGACFILAILTTVGKIISDRAIEQQRKFTSNLIDKMNQIKSTVNDSSHQ